MAAIADRFDLGHLAVGAGEARRLELEVPADPLIFAGEPYAVMPVRLRVSLDAGRTTGRGWSLRLRFAARLEGPCMRCLGDAAPAFRVDAREIEQPGGGDELQSPYVQGRILDLRGWARDALALAVGAQILCRPDCLGLCPVCGTDLNVAGPDHGHERALDRRWAKLSELRLE